MSKALVFCLVTHFKILGWCEQYGVWKWWWWKKEGGKRRVRCLERWGILFSVPFAGLSLGCDRGPFSSQQSEGDSKSSI